MRYEKRIAIGTLSLLLLLSACDRERQTWEAAEVTFSSSPAGATVLVNDEQLGVTPLSVRLYPKASTRVIISHPGYEDASIQLAIATSKSTRRRGGRSMIDGGTIDHPIEAVVLGTTSSTTTSSELSTRETEVISRFDKDSYHITLTPVNATSRRIEARRVLIAYALANYPELSAEAHDGDGTYLRGLAALLDHTRTPAELAVIARREANAPRFATAIAGH